MHHLGTRNSGALEYKFIGSYISRGYKTYLHNIHQRKESTPGLTSVPLVWNQPHVLDKTCVHKNKEKNIRAKS